LELLAEVAAGGCSAIDYLSARLIRLLDPRFDAVADRAGGADDGILRAIERGGRLRCAWGAAADGRAVLSRLMTVIAATQLITTAVPRVVSEGRRDR
jgi:hypothetical protein